MSGPSAELLSQYDSSERFLAYRAVRERDEVKRRQLLKEYAQCVSERARVRLRWPDASEAAR